MDAGEGGAPGGRGSPAVDPGSDWGDGARCRSPLPGQRRPDRQPDPRQDHEDQQERQQEQRDRQEEQRDRQHEHGDRQEKRQQERRQEQQGLQEVDQQDQQGHQVVGEQVSQGHRDGEHQDRQEHQDMEREDPQGHHDDHQEEQEDDEDCLTHLELGSVYRRTLADLLAADPLLCDLPPAPTAAEVRSLLALEHGSAMAVLVSRGDKLTRVIVERTATVRDLKRALRSAVELEQERLGRRRRLSWRYVWRANWLRFRDRFLTDDAARLTELGLANRAEVRFVPRIRAKRGQRGRKGGQLPP